MIFKIKVGVFILHYEKTVDEGLKEVLVVIHSGENKHSGEKQTLDNALQKIEEGSSAIQLFTRQYTRTISDLERQATEKNQLIEELTKKLEKSEKKAKEA